MDASEWFGGHTWSLSIQEWSGNGQTLAVSYHVERVQGSQGMRYQSYEMPLVHRMRSAPQEIIVGWLP
jgi:hypothetical protein